MSRDEKEHAGGGQASAGDDAGGGAAKKPAAARDPRAFAPRARIGEGAQAAAHGGRCSEGDDEPVRKGFPSLISGSSPTGSGSVCSVP